MSRSDAATLRALHTAPEILVLTDVWDVASAQTVAAVPACKALSTSGAAMRAVRGYTDTDDLPFDAVLRMLVHITSTVDKPLSADLEAGYGNVSLTVRQAIQAGVVGASLEDQMRPLGKAVAAVRMAVTAAQAEGVPMVLNARTDTFWGSGARPSAELLPEAVKRGRAYLDAGADCVYVPGARRVEDIQALVNAFGPGRLALLGMPGMPTPSELQMLGVARVSYGRQGLQVALGALVGWVQRITSA
jgi:2-methylisocitrate lyase-like PEP mutase family enzyme